MKLGKHKVNFYVDNSLKATHYYTLAWDFTEHRLSKDMVDNLPVNESNTFLQTDDRVYTWSNFDKVSQAGELRCVFYEPSGAEYLTIDGSEHPAYAFEDPYDGVQQDHWDWYRVWAYIDIRDNSAAWKTGNWRLEFSIKNPFTNLWEPYYDDHFQILEAPNVIPTVEIQPGAAVAGSNLVVTILAADNTYLGETRLYWSVNGQVQDQRWPNLNSPNFSRSYHIPNLAAGDSLQVWAEAYDNSGNRGTSVIHTIPVAAPPTLALAPSGQTVSARSGQVALSVANTGGGLLTWTMTTNAPWLSLNTQTGSNNGMVGISYPINNGPQRQAVVTATAGTQQLSMTLIQQAYQPPAFSILEPNANTLEVDELLTIVWSDGEATDHQIQWYYDTDDQGWDGQPIGASLPTASAQNSVDWNTSAIPEGTYFLYAVISNGEHAPTRAYSPAVNISHAPLEADLSISISNGGTSLVPGAPVVYRVEVENLGPRSVSQVSFNHLLPSALTQVSWNCLTPASSSCTNQGTGPLDGIAQLAVGDTALFTIGAIIDPTAKGNLDHQIEVVGPNGMVDLHPENNTARDLAPLTPSADLALIITGPLTALQPESLVRFTLKLTNMGSSQAENISLSLSPDPSFSNIVIDAPGWTVTSTGPETVLARTNLLPGIETLQLVADTSATPGDYIISASLSADTNDPLTGNNAAQFQIHLLAPGECQIGDVTANGEITAFDATQVLKHAALLPTSYDPIPLCAGDATCNGEITAFDATQILKYDAQLITELPCVSAKQGLSEPYLSTLTPTLETLFLDQASFALPLILLTDDHSGIEAIQGVIDYDPALLEIDGISLVGTQTAAWLWVVNNSQPGQLTFGAAGHKPCESGDVVVKLIGRPLSHGQTSLEISSTLFNEDPGQSDGFPLTLRYCLFPKDFLENLPLWQTQDIRTLLPLLQCESGTLN